jgi:NADH-quinone oxidoreductase subunit N
MIATNPFEFYYLAPIIIIVSAIVILLLLLLFKTSTKICAIITAVSLAAALISTMVLGTQLYKANLDPNLSSSIPMKMEGRDQNSNSVVDDHSVPVKDNNDVISNQTDLELSKSAIAETDDLRASTDGLEKSSDQDDSDSILLPEEPTNEQPAVNIQSEQEDGKNIISSNKATYITPLFTCDGYGLLYTGLVLMISLVVVSFAYSWFKCSLTNQGLFYLILLFSTLGGIILVYSCHLISLFIGIELLSMPLIGLIGFQYTQTNSIEATIKYMVLSAVATSFLLLGIAYYYAATGDLTFSGLSFKLSTQSAPNALLLTSICLIMVGIGFKLSLFPFQLWLPDVFQGAPTAISLFLSTVGKMTVFCAIARLFLLAPIVNNQAIQLILIMMAFSSIVIGNLFALMQINIKRLFAYASIANFGYLFIALIAVQYQVLALETIGVYLIGYLLSNICVLGVISTESSSIQNHDKETVHDLRGLFWRKPIIAISMAIGLLSLAGMPLTIGFIGRFSLLLLSVTAELWLLVGAIVIGSVFGLYFYLRIIINLYLRDDKSDISLIPSQQINSAEFNWKSITINDVIIVSCALLILFCGIYPELLFTLVSSARYLIP